MAVSGSITESLASDMAALSLDSGDVVPLVVLDVNGVMVERSQNKAGYPIPHDFKASKKFVWKRPGLDAFLDGVFASGADVMVWTSMMRKNVEPVLNKLLKEEHMDKFIGIGDQALCDSDPVRDPAKRYQPFLKPINNILASPVFNPHGRYRADRILIVDDGLKKLRFNPPNSMLIVPEYSIGNPDIDFVNDDTLERVLVQVLRFVAGEPVIPLIEPEGGVGAAANASSNNTTANMPNSQQQQSTSETQSKGKGAAVAEEEGGSTTVAAPAVVELPQGPQCSPQDYVSALSASVNASAAVDCYLNNLMETLLINGEVDVEALYKEFGVEVIAVAREHPDLFVLSPNGRRLRANNLTMACVAAQQSVNMLSADAEAMYKVTQQAAAPRNNNDNNNQ